MADVELMEPATAFRMARGAAERAIELDSNTAQGYPAMAWLQINVTGTGTAQNCL
jgi:hypothetical protein